MHLTQAPKILFFPPSNLTFTSMIFIIQIYKHIWMDIQCKKRHQMSDTYTQQQKSLFHATCDQEGKYLE